MKRFTLLFALFAALCVAIVATPPAAHAGIFGDRKAATPSPSPSPSALPTATPEPPSIAIPRLQAKLKANPNDQEAMVQLAGQFLAINRADLAAQLTQHLLQMGDKDSQVYYLDAYAMQDLNHNDAAMADLEQAENLDPSNPGVLQQLVAVYLKANRFSDAERIANRAIVLNNGDVDSYMLLGDVYATEQKYEDARIQFNIAESKDPKDADPVMGIAQTYASQDNIPVALQFVQRALALDPKNVQTLIFKADLYARQHDDVDASAGYDDAIVAAPTDEQKVQIVVHKADYFASEKKTSQAESIFLQGIAQYPRVPAIYVAYGDFLIAQNNIAKAKTEFQQAVAIDPDYVDALGRLGQLAMRDQHFQDAVGYLKHLTDVSPDPSSFALLGQAYSYTHDYASSKDACSKSFQMQRTPEMLGCIAGADYELKNYKEASQIFDVLDNNAQGFLEQNPELLFVAGKCYDKTQQVDKALNAYRRLLPMVRNNAKQYAQVQAWIKADTSKPAPKPKKKP